MTILSVQTPDIDLPLRVVSYRKPADLREYETPERRRLLREPRPRYDHGKAAAAGRVPAAEKTGPHPFNKDLRWKMIIESLPREFLRFFAPEIAAGMDPRRKITFLDKELLELLPAEGKRLAPLRVDKLLKVPMLDGSDVTLHCEVQGSSENGFPSRMHRYYICLAAKYPGQVTAIAILTDGDKGFRPGPFRETRGPKKIHRLCYDYAVYKVLDQSEKELERSDNPFALVILTVKAALKRLNNEYSEEEYCRRKLELVDWLKKRSVADHQEQAPLSFLKYYVPFKDQALETKFNEQLKERSKIMGIVESLINEAKEEGLEQGLEQGLQQGIEKGKLSFVQYLLENTEFDDEKIASLAAVDVSRVREMRAHVAIKSTTG